MGMSKDPQIKFKLLRHLVPVWAQNYRKVTTHLTDANLFIFDGEFSVFASFTSTLDKDQDIDCNILGLVKTVDEI